MTGICYCDCAASDTVRGASATCASLKKRIDKTQFDDAPPTVPDGARHFLFANLMKTTRNQIARLLIFLLIIAAALIRPLSEARGWGPHGHEISGRAAAMKLPEQTPKFFRKAVDQLSYLNPEPDRWRDRAESDMDKAMDSAYAPDHFLDLELVPSAAFNAVNRYKFTAELLKDARKPTAPGI